jgi:hypothetical protein
MEMHAEICGKIHYQNLESLKTAVKRLEKGGWITKDHFTDDCGNYIGDEMPDIDYKKLTIEIPWFSYHNLVFHLDNLSILFELWIKHDFFLCLLIKNVNSFLFSLFMLILFDNHELIMRHSFFLLSH